MAGGFVESDETPEKMNAEVKKWIEKEGLKFFREIGVREKQTLLDFGCGEGHYTIPASKVVGRSGKVYALDKDRSALNKLKKFMQQSNIKNVELINEDSVIPLENEAVDVVLCYDVIHYCNRKDRKAIYNEVHRVLKKEGIFSVYPKHHKEDSPLSELADIELGGIIKEIEGGGFYLEHKFSKVLLHDGCYSEGYILNFGRI